MTPTAVLIWRGILLTAALWMGLGWVAVRCYDFLQTGVEDPTARQFVERSFSRLSSVPRCSMVFFLYLTAPAMGPSLGWLACLAWRDNRSWRRIQYLKERLSEMSDE